MLTPVLPALIAVALAAPSSLDGIHVVAAGNVSAGLVPGAKPSDQPVWLRTDLPVWRYGGALELDLLRGVASSLQFTIPVMLASSRFPGGSGGTELGGFEVVPTLRVRIRAYTHLDVLLDAGLGMLFHDTIGWHDGEPRVDGHETNVAWSLSLGVEWAIHRSFGLRFGPAMLWQDTGPLYLGLAGGVSWSP